jgi:hypothetical protein
MSLSSAESSSTHYFISLLLSYRAHPNKKGVNLKKKKKESH